LPNYIRNRVKGGCYFFTVNLLQRHNNQLLIDQIELLRETVQNVKQKHPFHIDGWVVLPEHMHFIITLPVDDDDYAKRIRLIKSQFARKLPNVEYQSKVRISRHERGIWQRRFWEHTIRNDRDYSAHMNYLHYNPVKHGYVKAVIDWPYSSFHRLVSLDVYPADWGGCDYDLNVGESG